MNVLHLMSGSITSGASRGAYWLHRALLEQGVSSHYMTTSRETFGDPTVISTTATRGGRIGTRARILLDNLPLWLRRHDGPKFSPAIAGYDFRKHPAYQSADIVHLHWINSGLVRIEHLRGIDKPMVWTMRDIWPATGGCHYPFECDRFKNGCGRCPQLNSRRDHDLSHRILKRKQRAIPKTTKLVCIADWMRDLAADSDVFRGFDIRIVHNSIDTDSFTPVDRKTAREILGIPSDKICILAGAQYLVSQFKGFDLLLRALQGLERDRYRLLTFGRLPGKLVSGLRLEHRDFGFLADTVALRLLYSSADMFVGPSIMDGLPKTLIEALSCGTPVVAFDSSGPGEIVTHQQDGYLARPFEIGDLARGIEWVAEHPDAGALSRAARANAVGKFDVKVAARKYVRIYEEISASGR